MGQSSAALCDAVQKYLTYVLKWYKVIIEQCALCSKSFITAYKDTVCEEVMNVSIVYDIRPGSKFV